MALALSIFETCDLGHYHVLRPGQPGLHPHLHRLRLHLEQHPARLPQLLRVLHERGHAQVSPAAVESNIQRVARNSKLFPFTYKLVGMIFLAKALKPYSGPTCTGEDMAIGHGFPYI